MRKRNPIARVMTAKKVMTTTELANADNRGLNRIVIVMLVKIKLDGTPIMEIARICGCAPCQILAVNGVEYENELMQGTIIRVPVITQHLVTTHLK